MAWTVDFYLESDGSSPVENFLLTLPMKCRAKAVALIQALEREGPNLPFPYSSQVRGRLRELRTQLGKEKIRILYFADARGTFVLLHGLLKRTARLDLREIEVAEGRMNRHKQKLAKEH